jgi:3'-5' exoribonuclease
VPRVKPNLSPLHELSPGQLADCFVRLVEKTHGTTREDKPFYTCRFSDSRRSVTVMVWSDSLFFTPCETEWEEGQFYKVRGRYVTSERYGPQFELEQIRPAQDSDREDGFDPDALVERSRFESAAMLAELREIIEKHISDEPLRRLVLTLLDRHAEPLQKLPATQSRYHPFSGGLLEHTLSVTRTSLLLAERYAAYYTELSPPLNVGLVVAGAVLHDLGRVLEHGDALGRHLSVPGRLVGHLTLGRDLVRDAAREQGDVSPELLQMLEHILVAHPVTPEWNSSRGALIPECLIIHHADELDARMEMFARCLSRDRAPGPFTDRDPALGRQLFKGRTV